ncbi:site-specific DNA-methyltransferase [Helicobacter pylori]|uniref:site-specific DNA-methyltransferase (adenine-specific) n=1 Tax=Helicobacter pylori TaxID=210 RepID=A0AAE7ARX3_HELPX|nr:site-specific DNA-methyltransferase [Helicobacter pylori]QJW39992.1 site-specific DNA-methyltransferase [Helicobacter pylori]QJW42900.1 site-specific DNA-methyltransferase [Helicobacter pylori]
MQNKEIGEEKSVKEKNLEVFNRYFPGCLSIENDDKLTLDTGRLKALLGDFSEIKEEGYGLDFVGKKIALNQAFKKNNKILKPLNESTSKHILIKGDNLDALKILKQSYSEKIKMIYIDPPYNTKNDNFIYSDDFSQSNEETLKQLDYSKEKLDYIKNLFGSKCHSGWLSFMYPRLLLAKDLLKQDGVIFISIDDNECAQLKLLCDEIFGEGNFVAEMPRLTKKAGKSTNQIAKNHDYVLCYQKNNINFKQIDIDENDYPLKDEFYNERGGYKLNQNLDYNSLQYNKKMDYEIVISNEKFYAGGLETYTERQKGNFGTIDWVWRWSKAKFDFGLANGFVEVKNNRIYTKTYTKAKISDSKPYKIEYFNRTKNISSIEFLDNKYSNDMSNKKLQSIFNVKNIFDYSKPVELISFLIDQTTEKGDIILDFFAGSGTTAHAVLESNKSDYQKLSEGGGLFNGLNAAFKERRFILVQLDEKIDPKKNKSAYDFCLNTLKSPSPSIFDITEERIKRAGAKIKEACPHLDVGFRAFEIIDDETHANDKNLSQAHQKDLFAYSNPKKRETQTILIKLLGCEGLELTTPINCLIENALYLALNTAFIVGDIEMSEVLENLKDKGVEKISVYMPAISNDRLCLELGSNLLDLKLESGDLKIRG